MRRRRNTSAAHSICARRTGNNSLLGILAIFILGQHYAVTDHLFRPPQMQMIALYTVWYNYVKQHMRPEWPFARDGGQYQRNALEHG